MTTIKSDMNPGTDLQILYGGEGCTNLHWRVNTIHVAAGTFPTAELLAALNAEPKTVAEHLRRELKAADADREAEHRIASSFIEQRDAAEAKLTLTATTAYHDKIAGEAQRQIHELETKLAAAEELVAIERKHKEKALDALKAAEAKLAEAEDLLGWIEVLAKPRGEEDFYSSGKVSARVVSKRLRAALADPEPFVLPTEAGAGIVAETYGFSRELRLFSDGVWRSSVRAYSASDVMFEFTGHRLIGGGEL